MIKSAQFSVIQRVQSKCRRVKLSDLVTSCIKQRAVSGIYYRLRKEWHRILVYFPVQPNLCGDFVMQRFSSHKEFATKICSIWELHLATGPSRLEPKLDAFPHFAGKVHKDLSGLLHRIFILEVQLVFIKWRIMFIWTALLKSLALLSFLL